MLELETYKQWTSAFTEGSYYEGTWEKGTEIKFLTPEGHGMKALTADNRLYEYLSIKHGAAIKKDSEQEDIPEAFENYIFSEEKGVTELTVEMDSPPDYEDFFNNTWRKALEKLKELSEKE